MKEFATLLNQLYFTYGNIEKRQLLEQFLSKTPDPERGYALGLIAGTLNFPSIKRSWIKSIMLEQIDPYLFELSYDYVGDLSETIALLWPDTPAVEKPSLPPLSLVVQTFLTSSDKALKDYLTTLLDQANTIERWAILKLCMGNLRIGVSARFLKNALAHYGQVEVQEIEKNWHALQPPYLDLFAWLEEKIPLKHSNVITFHPVMLSHPLLDAEVETLSVDEFLIEKKYDGIRVELVSTGEEKAIFTRTGDNINRSFPDALLLFDGEVVLDGELLVYQDNRLANFNSLQKRLNRQSPSPKLIKDSPAYLILYDILKWDGRDLRAEPLSNRRHYLEQWVNAHAHPHLMLSPLLNLTPPETLFDIKHHILAENNPAVEGLMLKHKQSAYIAGRPKGFWYKWKREPFLIDAVLMYAQRGHGKRSSYYSDYTFGLWQEGVLLPVGKAYSGFTDETLIKLDRWVRYHTLHRFGPVRELEKNLVVEVAFDAVQLSSRHKSGLALRFPRLKRVRWDKPAAEADQLEALKTLIN